MTKKPRNNYSTLAFIHDIARLIKPYKGQFWFGTFLRLSGDIANLYPAWALSQIVVILSQPPVSAELFNKIVLIIGGWLACSLYYSITHALAKLYGYRVSERVALDARLKALTHIFSLDIAWQQQENTGNKLKRIDHGSRGLDRVIRIFFDVIVEATLNSIGMFFIFMNIGTEIGLSMLAFMITYFWISFILTKKAAHQSYAVNEIQESLEGLSFEALNNIKTVKSLGIHQAILASLTKYTQQTFAAIKQRIKIFRLRSGVLLSYQLLFKVAISTYIIFAIIDGHYTVALLILFIGYFGKVEEAISELAEVTHELVVARVDFHRLVDILNVKPSIETNTAQLQFPQHWKTIEFKNISFSYEKKVVFQDFNLTIHRGEKVGIVGLSGAGKTTLFNLLLDLYENYEGDILFDGVSLKNIQRQDYINHVSVVLQETELFNATLKENLLIGSQPEKLENQSQLSEAISSSYLDDVIDRMPSGVDTVVGEKGVKLSGGEKQRLGIARALYRQPDILLLDEATSHLDVESEKKIQTSLHKFFNKVTAIVIAHRLSTIQEMDKIIVLQNGVIAEQGNFAQLLRQKSVFAQLWEKQKL